MDGNNGKMSVNASKSSINDVMSTESCDMFD